MRHRAARVFRWMMAIMENEQKRGEWTRACVRACVWGELVSCLSEIPMLTCGISRHTHTAGHALMLRRLVVG